MTTDEYASALAQVGCARGNKGIIQNKDGSVTLVYAVRGCSNDLYLATETDLTCEQLRAQFEAACDQIDRLKASST